VTFIGPATASAGSRIFALALGALSWLGPTPQRPRSHQLPNEDGPLALWHWIEDNGEIVFPLIGFVILALVFIAVKRSSVNQEAELATRRKQMDAIVRLMRARLSLTADQTASELQVDRYRAASMLDELVKEGALVQGRLPGGVISYRLKGL